MDFVIGRYSKWLKYLCYNIFVYNKGFVNSRSSIRREMEKPPRLQKQLSRDRLPGGNKQNITADGATSNVGLQAHGERQ